jgi:hypothetical protein
LTLDDGAYVSDAAVLDELYARHVEDADNARVPLWIGEYGGDGVAPNFDAYQQDLLARWRPDFVGFSRWSYDSIKDYDFSVLDEQGDELASLTAMIEPYAERIPGTPKATAVNLGARELSVTSTEVPSGQELVLSCPVRFCDGKASVELTADGQKGDPIEVVPNEDGQIVVSTEAASELGIVLRW